MLAEGFVKRALLVRGFIEKQTDVFICGLIKNKITPEQKNSILSGWTRRNFLLI